MKAIELGRHLVGDSGIYAYEIANIKSSPRTTFAIINGRLHQRLSASGNFEVIIKNYPLDIGNKIGVSKYHTVQIVGSLCTLLYLMANKYS